MISAVPMVNAAPVSSQQGASGASGLGKDDFMNLLLASLQHQDPLNPLEPTEFSAQLAQFSSLEQLMQINQRLDTQAPGSAPSDRLSLVGLIGKEVTVKSNLVAIEKGESSPLKYDLDRPGLVTLKVRTVAGNTVADLVLGTKEAGTQELRLDQVAALSDLPDGSYEVELALTNPEGTATALVTKAVDRVTGVVLGKEPRLLLGGGGSVGIDEVVEVREPSEG